MTGVLVAGVLDLITLRGQGASWRWFFRVVTVMIVPLAAMSFALVPRRRGAEATEEVGTAKWRRLDLPGSLLMLAAIVLLIPGLTPGAASVFAMATFLEPFLLSLVVLVPAVFVWEARVPAATALLPPAFWRAPNVAVLAAFALYVFQWWGVNFLAHVEVYTTVRGESGLLAAVRMLPPGIASFAVVLVLTLVPRLMARPPRTVIVGMLESITGMALFTRETRYTGDDYWRWMLPGSIIGSGAQRAVFTAANVALTTAVDPQMAGVAGAVLQVAFQICSAVGFGVQAGMFTIQPGGLDDYRNVQASFYFQLGWGVLWLFLFVLLYRVPKTAGGPSQLLTSVLWISPVRHGQCSAFKHPALQKPCTVSEQASGDCAAQHNTAAVEAARPVLALTLAANTTESAYF